MGPRGAARRSEGEVISEQHDKSPSAAASRCRELCRRRGTWAYLALLAAVSAVCAFLPLADHLGYELAEVVALCAGLFAAALGTACGFAAPRRAGWIVAAVFTATLVVSLWPVARGPQIFAFHHLGGWFPGPIYDEGIRPSRSLWIFRTATILYAGACAGAALLAGPGRRRAAGLALVAACGLPAAWLSLHAERFHWKATAAGLDAELGGSLRTEHIVLHFPREKRDDERRLLARDAEVSWRAVREFAGLPIAAEPVDVFLYRSPEEKRRLTGAAETSFTKPWLRQIHTNDAPAPHPILRHELAHAAFAEIAPGPFGVPGEIGRAHV